MAVTLKTTHAAQALGRLLEQFKNKTDLAAWLSTYIAEIQEVENMLVSLNTERTLDSAVGVQLDGIGRIIGQARDGQTDDVYRIRIKARIALNLSSGTVEEVLTIMGLVLDGCTFWWTSRPPASYVLDVHGATTTADAVEAAAIMGEASAAGVNSQLVYSESSDADTFTFSSGDTEEASTAQGWADDAQTTGGFWADVETA